MESGIKKVESDGLKESEDRCLICGGVFDLEDMYYVKHAGVVLGNVCTPCNDHSRLTFKTRMMFLNTINDPARLSSMVTAWFPYLQKKNIKALSNKMLKRFSRRKK
jgi:CRISPR/Cas system-associated protein Cas10 (large subunit of type III CRISPR-Cas system)